MVADPAHEVTSEFGGTRGSFPVTPSTERQNRVGFSVHTVLEQGYPHPGGAVRAGHQGPTGTAHVFRRTSSTPSGPTVR
jgi:hypothetical protein